MIFWEKKFILPPCSNHSMTHITIQKQIQEQIAALQNATANATKSKKAANKYLVDAGIISKL
jgi:hypothetical protein